MRQVTRKGLITVAAATGVLAVTGGYAHADSGAQGDASNSPGVASGNNIQVPVNAPVNACGNTVNVVGLLNPAAGNDCSNPGGKGGGQGGTNDDGGSAAQGESSNSPGIASGNKVQIPVDVPVNACGNSVSVVGAGNSTSGNSCGNDSTDVPPPGDDVPEEPPGQENPDVPGDPERPGQPQPEPPHDPDSPDSPDTPADRGNPAEPNEPGTQTVTQPEGRSQLAQTGSDVPIGLAVPVGAGLLLAGAVVYRRARQSA